MSIAAACPRCRQTFELPDRALGETIRCPACSETFRAPPTASDAVPPASDEDPDNPPEVLPVLPAEESPDEPLPVLEVVPDEDDRPARRGRRPEDRRPEPRQAPSRRQGWGAGMVLLILGVVLLLCGGFGTLAYFAARGIRNAASNPPIPRSDWRTFQPEVGRCSMLTPGTPRLQTVYDLPGTNGIGRRYLLDLSRYHRTFTFAVADLSPQVLARLGDDPLGRLTDAERKYELAQPGRQRVVEDQPITSAGALGREMYMQGQYYGRDNALIVRELLVRRRDGSATVYILGVEGPSVAPENPEVTRFFNSFTLDANDPEPNPRPNPNPAPNPNPNPNPQPNPQPPPQTNPNRLKLLGDRLRIHPGGTRLVRYAPDGKTLAALGEDGVLKLVDLPDFDVRATLPAVAGPYNDLKYSKDGTLLAVVAGDKVYLHAAATGDQEVALSYQQPVAVTFAPDDKKLAVAVRKPADEGSEVHFWDRDRRAEDGEPLKLPAGLSDLAWSPDGSTLAVAVGGEVRLLDPATRQPRRTITAHAGPITWLAFAPDGRSLVTAGGDRLVKRWSVADGKLQCVYEGHSNPAGRPAFSPDGSRLVTFGGTGDEVVYLWDTASGRPLTSLVNAPAQTGDVSFSRDGRTVALAARNQAIRLWNTQGVEDALKSAPPYGKPARPEEAVRFQVPIAIHMVRFSPDGKTLAVAGREGDLLLLDVADWRLVATKNSGRRSPAITFAYGSDGRLVAAGGGGGSARLYLRNGVSGALLSDSPAGDGWVRCLAVAPDRQVVAVGFDSVPPPRLGQQPRPGAAAFVRLWDVSGEPKLLGTLEKLPYPMGGLAFGPDGKTLYATAGSAVRRWRTETREALPALEGALADLATLAVAPDGRVYAAGQDMLIHSWDAEGRHGTPLEGHRDAVTGLALTTDGKRLASVSRDGTCRLWDTATGTTTAVTEDRSQGGHVATGLPTFSPDGTLLVVAADYNIVSVLRTARIKGQAPAPPVPAKKPSTEPGAVAAFDQVETHFFVNAGFSDNGTLLTANNIGGLQRWDWPEGKFRDEQHHQSAVHELARSRDGKLVALASGNAVYLRDGVTGELRTTVHSEDADRDPWARLVRIALSPDGDLLALAVSLQKDHEVIVWDVKAGRQLSVVRSSSATSLAFSPDGKTLAVGLFGPSGVTLYDARTLKEDWKIAGQQRGVSAVAFSPGGKKLATSSDNGAVKMWDLADGKELWSKPWSLANAWRQSVCFSPDGKWLVAAPLSREHGLVLVDVADGKLRAEVTRYPMPNSDPSFSLDGKFLAVVRKVPGQVVVYDVEKLLAAPAP